MSKTYRNPLPWYKPSAHPASGYQQAIRFHRESGKPMRGSRKRSMMQADGGVGSSVHLPHSQGPKGFWDLETMQKGSRSWAKRQSAKIMRRRGNKEAEALLRDYEMELAEETLMFDMIAEDYDWEPLGPWDDLDDDYDDGLSSQDYDDSFYDCDLDYAYDHDYDYDYDWGYMAHSRPSEIETLSQAPKESEGKSLADILVHAAERHEMRVGARALKLFGWNGPDSLI